MTKETKKVWRFHYQLTLTEKPNETILQVVKDRLRSMADELTLENFGEEEVNA